jgi:glycosyltransferase involved in cell wall biosynthesis
MRKTLRNLARRFKYYPLGILASEFKGFVVNTPKEMRKLERRFVSLKPKTSPIGNMLLCYDNHAFFAKPGDPFLTNHTNRWEASQIARTFLDWGYRVDVINENNDVFIPTKKYSVFVGNRINFQRIALLLNKDCIKILHIDTAHWLFNNMGEGRRLELLQQRRGINLLPQRNILPNFAIEYADYATILGNEFTMSTYQYAGKPLFRTPISTPMLYPWQEDKDFGRVRNNFLWFGSEGFVHKGLDLVLEAFVQMPDHHLTVCGPIHSDKEFQNAYQKELYQTANIHTVGWVDIGSPKFMEIVKNCVGIVFPSCSEGGGGGVITCMHAGLIPIVSYEASVDVNDTFGRILKASSAEEIKSSIQKISMMDEAELAAMARRSWEFARANHTREVFVESYSRIISEILAAAAKGEKAETHAVGETVMAASPELASD